MTTLYLIRHGETGGNSEGRFQGIVDNPLNDAGVHQAENLGEYFNSIQVDEIYASPLIRSQQTAKIIAQHYTKRELTPVVERGLMEMNGGLLEGMKFSNIKEEYPEVMEAIQSHLATLQCPQGESMREVYDRITGAINHIIEINDGKTVLVIGHGISIAAYVHSVSGKPYAEMPNDLIENATALCFHAQNGQVTLEHIRQIIPDRSKEFEMKD